MKKLSILALAAGCACAAQAQSSVTLYGVADAAFERVKGATSVSRVASGQQQGSRWGLRGTEDLGGGLKAVFQMEAGFNMANGASGQGGLLFGRQAYAGLAGDFGAVRIGRQYSPMDDVASLVGTKVYDVLSVVPIIGNGDYNRVNSAVTYLSPKIANTTFQAQYNFGNPRPTGDASPDFGRQFSVHAIHANGPLTLGVSLMRVIDDNATTAGDQPKNAALLVAGYDFGGFKLTGYYDQEDKGTQTMKVYGLQGGMTFGNTTVSAGVAQAKNVTGLATAARDDAKLFTLQASHNLSNRTAVYAHLTAVSNGADSALGFNSPVAGKNSNGMQVGIRHRF
ncbi:MAG TPA: porin [Burkholderiaceae bacterium]|nr:porin [Burkholderiaceae bacterium]